jgi:hypothetical protein
MSLKPFFCVLFVAVTTPTFAAPLPMPRPEQVRRELDMLWLDLLSADELIAGRAILKFGGQEETVGYLKVKLFPLKLNKQRAKQLISELGSKNEKTAQLAFKTLAYFDPRLAFTDEEMRDALMDRPESRRLGAILCDLPMDALGSGTWHWHSPDNQIYHFSHTEIVGNRNVHRNWNTAIAVADIGKHGRNSNWIRATRAIAVLENIGSDEAMAIVKSMATGHPDAGPTKAAKSVLQRRRLK